MENYRYCLGEREADMTHDHSSNYVLTFSLVI